MPIRPSLDYTDRDYDALKARIDALVVAVFPTWTDRQQADFGNILLGANAFVGDVLSKYQDNQAAETRWTTATLRENLLKSVPLIGYVPKGVSAARAELVFSLPAPAVGDVTILAGSTIRTEEVTKAIVYQLLADVVIQAGQTSATGVGENSEAAQDLLISNGSPNQSFVLARAPYIDGSVIVTAADGAYVQVDNLLDSLPSDRHFISRIDTFNRVRITFGNGINGSVPVGSITADYKTGGGAGGKVEAEKLKRLDRKYMDAFGTPVTVSVINPQPSAGGFDAQSVESIREEAPRASRVNARSIAREDFEIVAESVDGVSRALHLARAEDPAIGFNQGFLLIVPDGSGVADSALLQAVRDAFADKPYWSSYDLSVITALYAVANIEIRAWPSSGVTLATMKANIIAALSEFFQARTDDDTKNETIDFGYYLSKRGVGGSLLPWSSIQNAARDAAGVAKIGTAVGDFSINGQRADLAVPMRHFPKLGTVVVIDGNTGTVI